MDYSRYGAEFWLVRYPRRQKHEGMRKGSKTSLSIIGLYLASEVFKETETRGDEEGE